MSKDSISELPVHYGEVTKDGIKIERPSEDAPRRQSSDDTPSPGRQNRQSAIIIHQASLGAPDQQIPARRSKDETSAEGDDYPRTKTRPPHGLEIARSGLARSDYRQSFRDRRGHDDFDRYSDDDDYDDPYYRPQRIRDRPYYTEDEYVPRRRPSHASRQSYRYPRDRYPRTMDDYSDGPRTPRKYYAQRKSTTSRGPPIVHESDGDEEVIYPKDTSPGVNRQIKFKDLSKEERKEIMRLPWVQWMDSDTKNHFVATLGEFIGTTMFLWFAFAGTQVANIPSGDSASNSTSGGATGFSAISLLYIAVVFGFSLMVNVWVFFRISGGLFNPAVTLAMWMTGAIPAVRAICLLAAQVTGSIAASALVLAQFPTALNVRTTLAGNTSLVQGVFIELVLTAELVFTILMLAKEKHKATFIAPVGIGLALFVAELVGVYYTGGSLNPARSLGPCVVTHTFDKEHWIYWVGPGGGALAAVLFYKFIKMLEYEVANPGQDADDVEEAAGAAMAAQEKSSGMAGGRAH